MRVIALEAVLIGRLEPGALEDGADSKVVLC
jgi:hypothetical protein